MYTILIATLLGVPVVITTTYLLRHYPHRTAILAGEAVLYAVPVFGYLALTVVLMPAAAPSWLRILSVLSVTAVSIRLAPTFARRTARRLMAAEDAERSQKQGDRQA